MLFIRIPPPRQLMQKESLDSLDHWKTNIRTFLRRDTVFKKFLATSFHWDPSQSNYGLQAQCKMTEEEVKVALVDFLSTLAGFLPHSYLTSKLVGKQKTWRNVGLLSKNITMCKLLLKPLLTLNVYRKSLQRTTNFFA